MQQKETKAKNETNTDGTQSTIVSSNDIEQRTKQESSLPSADTGTKGYEERANKWAVLAIVAIGVFMATLDSSIVNISLPAIVTDFGTPLAGPVDWITIS